MINEYPWQVEVKVPELLVLVTVVHAMLTTVTLTRVTLTTVTVVMMTMVTLTCVMLTCGATMSVAMVSWNMKFLQLMVWPVIDSYISYLMRGSYTQDRFLVHMFSVVRSDSNNEFRIK